MKPVKFRAGESTIAVRLHAVQYNDIFFSGDKRAPLIFEVQLAFSDKKQEKGVQTGSPNLIARTAGIEGLQPDIKEVIFCKCGGSVYKDAFGIQNVLLHLDYIFFRDLPHNCSFLSSGSPERTEVLTYDRICIFDDSNCKCALPFFIVS
jgi:hypothetical protein